MTQPEKSLMLQCAGFFQNLINFVPVPEYVTQEATELVAKIGRALDQQQETERIS